MTDHHSVQPKAEVSDGNGTVSYSSKRSNLKTQNEVQVKMEMEDNEIKAVEMRCTSVEINVEEFCVKHLTRGSKCGVESGSMEEEENCGSSSSCWMKKRQRQKRKPKVSESIGSGGSEAFSLRRGLRARKSICVLKEVDEQSGDGKTTKKSRKYTEVNINRNSRETSDNCHQCQRHDKGGVVRCKSCKTKRYCFPCAGKWYPNMSHDDIAEKCPFCRRICNCKACLRFDKIDYGLIRLPVYSNQEKQLLSKYLISALLPHIRQLFNEQQSEKDIEAEIRGISSSKLHVQCIDSWPDERFYCDYCKTSIINYHRSCPNCSFDLCLTCCHEVRDGSIRKDNKAVNFQYVDRGENYVHGKVKTSKTLEECTSVKPDVVSPEDEQTERSNWEAAKNGSIPCPPAFLGGCGAGILDLYCILPVDIVADVANDAETAMFIRDLKDETTASLKPCPFLDEKDCSVANNETLYRAARREDSFDNYIYCPIKEIHGGNLAHFQSHWRKGQPVIIRNLLDNSFGLSWEPKVMWRAFRQMRKTDKARLLEVTVLNCLGWQEEIINIHQFFKGYSMVQYDEYGWPQLLKLDDWPPSNRFEEMLPRHSADFLNCLPFKDYTHPQSGYWNLATKLPRECLKPDLGPKMYIDYGITQEIERGDSVTKLRCEITDAVYLLTHAANLGLNSSEWQNVLNNIKKIHRAHDMMEIYGGKDLVNPEPVSISSTTDDESVQVTDGAAIWDVFRREDVPKLHEYLKNHHLEFRHIHCNPVYEIYHPIHDQSLYLSSMHKRNLKEEYEIEPWTFLQKVGDAVFIPAGCPYQVRNLKSCTKVAMDFLSPESIGESLRLVEELRQLPKNHEAKENKPEVKKMMVYAMKQAIDDLSW